jgi:hypothetical protein
MGLTRDFKKTVRELAMAEPSFRRALLKESIELFSSGDFQTGKIVLRDYINATVGFQALGNALNLIPKSLMRMLSPSGNPRARTLFEIMSFLQKEEGVSFTLQFRSKEPPSPTEDREPLRKQDRRKILDGPARTSHGGRPHRRSHGTAATVRALSGALCF